MNKENGPQQAYYIQRAMPTSSANQPMAEQTGQQATRIKGAHSDQRDSFIRKGVTGNTHIKKGLIKTEDTTCPTARPRSLMDRAHYRSPGTLQQHSAPVAASSTPPWTSGQPTA